MRRQHCFTTPALRRAGTHIQLPFLLARRFFFFDIYIIWRYAITHFRQLHDIYYYYWHYYFTYMKLFAFYRFVEWLMIMRKGYYRRKMMTLGFDAWYYFRITILSHSQHEYQPLLSFLLYAAYKQPSPPRPVPRASRWRFTLTHSCRSQAILLAWASCFRNTLISFTSFR